MKDLLTAIKTFFKREKSPEAKAMWVKLQAPISTDKIPELDMDVYYSLETQKKRDKYLINLMNIRNEYYKVRDAL